MGYILSVLASLHEVHDLCPWLFLHAPLTWGVWQAQGSNTRAGLDQERVSVTVVAANELDDLQALKISALQYQLTESCHQRPAATCPGHVPPGMPHQ
jgi:hypothetical protein